MALERTFSIVKPDATKRNLVGQIVAKFEEGGLRVVAQKRIQLTLAQAQQFYGVHSERPFFGELCEFMISEPIVVQVLEGENAILRIEKLWVQPIHLKLRKELFVKNLLYQLVKTLFMVQMHQKLLLKKLAFSFLALN
jgi:hypothetical protein